MTKGEPKKYLDRHQTQRLIELTAQIADLEDKLAKSDMRTKTAKTRQTRLENLKKERDALTVDTTPKVVAPDVLPDEDGDVSEKPKQKRKSEKQDSRGGKEDGTN